MNQPASRRRFQFHLRTLMIGVFAFSFALAAMRFGTIGWATATVSFTILLLLSSVVLAAYRRAFWVGFAICGIGYFVLVESHFAGDLVDRLITTRSINSLFDLFHPQADYVPPGWVEANLKGLGRSPNFNQREVSDGNRRWQEIFANFRVIVPCLWVLVIATLGGMLARFAAGRSQCPDRS